MLLFMFGHVDCMITVFALEKDFARTFTYVTTLLYMHFKAQFILKAKVTFITQLPILVCLGV